MFVFLLFKVQVFGFQDAYFHSNEQILKKITLEKQRDKKIPPPQ